MKFDNICNQQYHEGIKLSQKHCIIGQESPFQIEMVQSKRPFCFYGGGRNKGMERTILEVLFFYIRSSKFMDAFKIMRSNQEAEAERNW